MQKSAENVEKRTASRLRWAETASREQCGRLASRSDDTVHSVASPTCLARRQLRTRGCFATAPGGETCTLATDPLAIAPPPPPPAASARRRDARDMRAPHRGVVAGLLSLPSRRLAARARLAPVRQFPRHARTPEQERDDASRRDLHRAPRPVGLPWTVARANLRWLWPSVVGQGRELAEASHSSLWH